MAIKLKESASMGGQGTPGWYRHDSEQLAGVTNLPSNATLGLDGVLIFPPSEAQELSGMVCVVILKTLVGDIRATVYESKKAPGTLHINPPQSREEKEDGEVVYHDEVKLPSKLIAQVLRYIETQVVMEEPPATDLGLGMGLGLGAGAGAGTNPLLAQQQQLLAQQAMLQEQLRQAQAQAQAQAQGQAPTGQVPADEDPFANHNAPQA